MKSRVLLAALFTELLVLLPTAAVARWYDPGTGSWLSDDPVFGQLNDPMSLNPHLYAHGNPTKYTDPTGEAVCRGRDEAACRALFAQAVRLHGALSSFSEKAVIQGSGGEVLSIEPSGGFGGLEFLPNTSNLAVSVDLGSPTAGNLDLEPISERTLAGLVGIFERFKRTGGFGAPGSPESNAFAKGALEGLSLQNPAEAGGLLDPSALFLTDKVLLGLSGSQMEMFQSAVAGHNQFLQRQYMGGYMLAATTMGLSTGLPGAAGADAAVDMDMAMMLRANELSNAQANSVLATTASSFPRESPIPALGRAFRTGSRIHPPSPGATRGMNQVESAARDVWIDCDEIAEAIAQEAKAAGENGALIRVTPAKGSELKVLEYGRSQQYVYHEVYTDGRYAYDPRLLSRPVPLGDWKRMMSRMNPGARMTQTISPR